MKSIMGNGGEQSTLIAEDWGYLNPPFGKNIAIASSHMNMTWCNMTHAHATARRNPSLSTYTSPYIHIYLHVYYGFAHLPPCWEGVFVCLSAVAVAVAIAVAVAVAVVVVVGVWEGEACENGARERK